MKRRSAVAVLLLLMFLLALPGLALAADFRAGENRLDIRGPVDDDVYAAGNDVVISGDVTGDVFAAARNVRLSGSTGHSLFAAAQRITISGTVGHSARVAGQDVVVTGTVTQDLLGAGQSVTIEPEGRVGRDVWAGGQDLNVAGTVDRDIRGGAAALTISGTVGRNVEVDADTIVVADGARIEGDLVYTSRNEADVEPGAVINGRTVRNEPRAEPDDDNPVLDAVFGFLRSVAGAFVLGLILLWLWPNLLPVMARTMRSAPLPSVGVGFAGLIGVPVAALLILIPALILGAFGSLPVLLLAAYGFLLMLAKAAVGYLVGRMILERNRDPVAPAGFGDALKALGVGVVLLTLIGLVPFIGGLVGFLVAILALGAGLVAYFRWRKARPAAEPPPPPPAAPTPEAGPAQA